MLEKLETYINAQKAIANYMLAFGFIMILLAVLIHFSDSISLLFGLKIGCLIFGLFSALSGYGYRLTEIKLHKKQTDLYHENPSDFHRVEKERMQKVVKNHPRIQILLVVISSIALLIALISKNTFVSGLLYSLVILSIGNLFIERVSKTSIDTYHEQLSNF